MNLQLWIWISLSAERRECDILLLLLLLRLSNLYPICRNAITKAVLQQSRLLLSLLQSLRLCIYKVSRVRLQRVWVGLPPCRLIYLKQPPGCG